MVTLYQQFYKEVFIPSFPRYNSKASLTSQTPSAPLAQDNTGKLVAEAGQKIGGDIMEFGVKWSNAVDTIQKTTAMANFKTGMLDIQQRAQNDPNYNNSDQYYREIEKLKADNLKGFSNKNVEMEMQAEFNYHGKVGQIQIENVYKKKMIPVYKGSLASLIDQEKNNPTEWSLENIKGYLDVGKRDLLIDDEEYQKELIKANDDLGVNRVNDAIFKAQTAEEVNEVKKNLISGWYENGGVVISPKDKNTMIKSIETKGRQIVTRDNFMSRVQTQNDTHELIDLSNNGLLTPSKLEEYFKTKRISNTTYKALQETLDSPVGPTANTDPKTYYDLTNELLKDGADNEQSITKILKANADGKLSQQDAKKIYEMHLIPSPEGFKSLSESQGGDDFQKTKANFDAQIKAVSDKRNWFRSAFKNFNDFFSGKEKEEKVSGAFQKLVDVVQSNKVEPKNIPAEADKIIGQENLKKHPDWAKLPEKGKQGIDRFGNKVTVYPDGRVVKSE